MLLKLTYSFPYISESNVPPKMLVRNRLVIVAKLYKKNRYPYSLVLFSILRHQFRYMYLCTVLCIIYTGLLYIGT